MEEKTNVMRILEQKKIPFQMHCYAGSGAVSGREVAAILGMEPERVFKTLVTVAKSGKNYVFVVPVEEKLDLKKAAKIVGEKSVEMLKERDLLPLTGYVHGGCSPIGMKKFFPTVIDQTAQEFATILVNAGKIGYQIEISASDLAEAIPIKIADLRV
ncbi:Cys-tRNA(Pro) deacylase [Clostridiales bacterium COT073_COT-073]|nr:Cys-tRNA(Pro) deacylase [Clostridiales bacterium COT073_COT-073]